MKTGEEDSRRSGQSSVSSLSALLCLPLLLQVEETPEPATEQLSSLSKQIQEFSADKKQEQPLVPQPRPGSLLPPEKAKGAKDENSNRAQQSLWSRGTSSPPAQEPWRPQETHKEQRRPHEPAQEARRPAVAPTTSPPTEVVSPAHILDSRPRIIDSNVKQETSSRGFGSRDFKSAYNGPRGNYSRSTSKVEPAKEQESAMEPTHPAKEKEVSPVKQETITPSKEVVKASPPAVVPRSRLPAIAPSPVSIPAPVKTPAPISTPSYKAAPVPSPASVPASAAPPVPVPAAPPVSVPVPAPHHTHSPTKATTPSPVPSPEASPLKEPSPVKSPETTHETTPVKTPEKSPEKSPVKTPQKIVIVSDENELEHNGAGDSETPRHDYQRTKSQEFRDYQADFLLTSTIDFGPLSSPLVIRRQPPGPASPLKTPSPPPMRTPSPPQPKTEISPSPSFLDNINRHSTLASTPSTPSSPPTPGNSGAGARHAWWSSQ